MLKFFDCNLQSKASPITRTCPRGVFLRARNMLEAANFETGYLEKLDCLPLGVLLLVSLGLNVQDNIQYSNYRT